MGNTAFRLQVTAKYFIFNVWFFLCCSVLCFVLCRGGQGNRHVGSGNYFSLLHM